MQPPEQLMVRVAEVCNRLRLPYFVTGSVASIAYGEARFTQVVDIVVELPSWNVREFCEAFPAPDYYVSPEAALAAAQGPGQFNIIWVPEGVKADIMIFSDTPFNESRLGRARKLTLAGGGEVMFSAPEDVILKKLEFFREGQSQKRGG